MSLNPINTIKANLGIEANGRVQKFFTNTCKNHMDKYVPMDSGLLRQNVKIETDKVIYQSPYAHYQYIGELYVDPETGSSYARKDAIKVSTGTPLIHHYPRNRTILGKKDGICRD